MHRRSVLKSISAATILASFSNHGFAAFTWWQATADCFWRHGIECSTYGRIRARMEDFTIVRGQELNASKRYSFLKKYPVTFMPTLEALAVPGGPVDRTTYETIKADFLARVQALLPLDGLYLPMHGAMFVDGMEDAEGDWMEAGAQTRWPDMPDVRLL